MAARHEQFVTQHLSKYRHKDLTLSEIIITMDTFSDLRPKYDTFVFSDNTRKDLLALDGTIPVRFKGATYNIPICIWLFETHPLNPPMCFVRPTQDMMIRPSRHVDASGKVYLPYLNEWKHPNCDLIGLIQVMTVIFGENSPVYYRPSNQPPRMPQMTPPYHESQPPPSQALRLRYMPITPMDDQIRFSERPAESESDRHSPTDRLKRAQLEKEEQAERLLVEQEKRQQVTYELRKSENDRIQLTHRLEREEQMRGELTDRLENEDMERRKLIDRLKEVNEEQQQLVSRFNAAERENIQLRDKLTESINESQQLSARLEMTEKEQTQLKARMLAKETQEQKLTAWLEVRERETKELTSRLEESDDERQQLTVKLETTEEKMRQLKERLEAKVKEEQQLTTTLEMTEEEKKELSTRLKASDDERQQQTGRLETVTEKNRQMERTLEATKEEKQHLATRLEISRGERRTLTKRVETSEREKEQLTTRLEVTEEENKELTHRLMESEHDRRRLTEVLEALKEGRRQLTEGLKAMDRENQHLLTKLEVSQEENKQLQQLTGSVEMIEEKMRHVTEELEAKKEEKMQLVASLTKTESERQQLSDKLSTIEEELHYCYDKEKRLKKNWERNQQELEETKSSLRAAKDELVQAQVQYAKESMALQEVLQQTREALSKQAVTSTDSVEKEHALRKEENETSETFQESAVLAANFGRLMVDVAEDLTLDNALNLALLFQLPDSEKDHLRRISLIETPGITLVNFLKTRNIINMYDVTNLQKGLMRLQLHRTNTRYVVPYQQKIDRFQFEENRSLELVDWPVEETEVSKANEISVPQETERAEKSEEPQNGPDKERFSQEGKRLSEKVEREKIPRSSQDFQIVHITQPYIEHLINDEGGTIALTGVSLSIPEEALTGDHVIAVTVFRDPDVLLPGTPQRGRMTPLIKLEPEGLKLKKPARLIIPHSAIIPEPDRHSVIIYTGQPTQGESQKGHITWTEVNSLKWMLEQEKICLDVNTLSYIYVNLVNQTMEQKHMFRVVPFIDGILDVSDDVLITVCFCKDNDAEYQLLLDDYKSKLILGNYMTFQVSRTLNEDNDGVFDLGLTMSPQIDSYCLTEKVTSKLVDIDHLCAASRVSLQFRLVKRSKERDDEMIDVKLEVSQGEKNKIALILQCKVKNILLSRQTKGILHQESTKDLHRYENLKETVSNLLKKKHCEKLTTAFELTPAERDTVLKNPKPGMELVKILDERELIMPDKVFGLYQALKASHCEKIGRLVLEYIDESQKDKMDNIKRAQEYKKETNMTKSNQENLLTRNAKLLIDEGYKRQDVKPALKLSHGKLDLGRRILLLAKDEHEWLPLLHGSNVHKEQYIDELGGELDIAGIHMFVPAGALKSGRIVSLSVSTDAGIKGPISNKSLNLTPWVTFGPMNLALHRPVILTIPHCAYIARCQTGMDVYSGVLLKGKRIKWSLERKHCSSSLKKGHLQVELKRPCGLLGPHILFQPNMTKHICVIPITVKTAGPMDEMKICLWFYNDDKLEHDSLFHEEVYNKKGIVLHDPVSFQLKTIGSTLPVIMRSSSVQWSLNPKKVDVDVKSLWLLNRQNVTFHLQTKGSEDTVNLEIESRYGFTRKMLFQFNFLFKLDDLHRIDQNMSPFQQALPKSTTESFKELLNRIPDHLDAKQSILLAKIFKLSDDVISTIESDRRPGSLLIEVLTEKYLLSVSNISRFEYALTELGSDKCAKYVREFRKINPVVHPTISLGDYNN